ncbi:MAG: glucose-1-phosphate thymidylyltransferase RfbA [Candidatus Zixiibacteriota bacterium]
MNKSGIHKGIILAGGTGSRLHPITLTACKQLLPIYDKPMIYYPLSTLLQLGVSEILIISTPADLPRFRDLFGDGHSLGVTLSYAEQPSPDGIAQALIIGEKFIGKDNIALILGDNIFYGDHDFRLDAASFASGATIYAYYVNQPNRYGVIDFDATGRPTAIDEKPAQPKSNYVVTGLYLYDSNAVEYAKALTPSKRKELEITDLNSRYLTAGTLSVQRLERGFAWLDTGTHDSLLEAGEFIATIEKRQGLKIGCIEEAAYRAGRIDRRSLSENVTRMPNSPYREYLEKVLKEVS